METSLWDLLCFYPFGHVMLNDVQVFSQSIDQSVQLTIKLTCFG